MSSFFRCTVSLRITPPLRRIQTLGEEPCRRARAFDRPSPGDVSSGPSRRSSDSSSPGGTGSTSNRATWTCCGTVPQGAGVILAANHADRDGLQSLPGTVPPLRPPVPLHDEPRGVRRGLRGRGLVAPTARGLLGRTRRPAQRGGETLRHRGGDAGTGGARHLPGRGDLLPERSGSAIQERGR